MASKTCEDIMQQLSDCICALAGERTSKNQGRVGSELKSKSLVVRWMVKKPSPKKDVDSQNDGDNIIKRGTIIIVPVKTGRGASASVLSYPFRVSLQSTRSSTISGGLPKFLRRSGRRRVKNTNLLDIRMIETNAMDEFSDVSLYVTRFRKKNVYKRINSDSE